MDPKRLKSLSLFENLSRKQLEQLSRWADEIDVPQGKTLAEQGRFAYEFFVIEEGTADVLQDGERITELGPGDFFGEIALAAAGQRTASVIATSAMVLIVMTSQGFESMQEEMPSVADAVRRKIEERLARDRGV